MNEDEFCISGLIRNLCYWHYSASSFSWPMETRPFFCVCVCIWPPFKRCVSVESLTGSVHFVMIHTLERFMFPCHSVKSNIFNSKRYSCKPLWYVIMILMWDNLRQDVMLHTVFAVKTQSIIVHAVYIYSTQSIRRAMLLSKWEGKAGEASSVWNLNLYLSFKRLRK